MPEESTSTDAPLTKQEISDVGEKAIDDAKTFTADFLLERRKTWDSGLGSATASNTSNASNATASSKAAHDHLRQLSTDILTLKGRMQNASRGADHESDRQLYNAKKKERVEKARTCCTDQARALHSYAIE